MTVRFRSRFLWLLLSVGLSLPGWSIASNSQVTEKPAASSQWKPVSPGKYDGSIAWVTATMLERFHYLHQPLDRAMSSRFLDRYIEALDPQHMHFLQSDIDDFEEYRKELGDLTVNNRQSSDLTP